MHAHLAKPATFCSAKRPILNFAFFHTCVLLNHTQPPSLTRAAVLGGFLWVFLLFSRNVERWLCAFSGVWCGLVLQSIASKILPRCVGVIWPPDKNHSEMSDFDLKSRSVHIFFACEDVESTVSKSLFFSARMPASIGVYHFHGAI